MSISQKNYDYVVVGAGTMGLSTALYLTLQSPDAKIALVEQYHFGHQNGASHSQTRVIRSTYDVQFFRDLALEAKQKYWPAVQKLLGQKLVFHNPYIAFIQETALGYQKYVKTAETSKTIKIISVEDAFEKFPYIPKITTCKHAFYEQGAGLILSMKYILGVANYLKKDKNIDVYQNTELISHRNNQQGVTLRIKNAAGELQIQAKKVALCCGHWLNKVVPQIKSLFYNVKQVVTYWKMKNSPVYKIGQFPTFVHVQECYDHNYVLPDGKDGDIKYMMYIHDPKYWDKNFTSDEEFEKTVLQYMTKKMAYHYGDEAITMTKYQICWYSITKEADFIIDWSDKHRNTLIVNPCSGQGFKFSPLIGKICTDLLEKDKSTELFQKFRHFNTLQYHFELNKQAAK